MGVPEVCAERFFLSGLVETGTTGTVGAEGTLGFTESYTAVEVEENAESTEA